MHIKPLLLCALFLALGATPPAHSAPKRKPLKYRLVWVMTNLLVEAQVTRVEGIMGRAKAAGYNGIMVTDSKFSILDQMDPRYFANVDRLKKMAASMEMMIIPAVFPIGYADSLLAHDTDLVEGAPVKDADFVVMGGRADIAAAGAQMLANPGFEEANGDLLSGWPMQDTPGIGTFVDTVVKHSGRASLRMQDIGNADTAHGHGRLMQPVTLKPFHHYHFSVWIKTENLTNTGALAFDMLVGDRNFAPVTWHVQPTQDWTRYEATFNSLQYDRANLYFGLWGGKTGKIWFDDADLQECGMVNLIRRDGCPLRVKGTDGTLYTEGKDFGFVRDARMGNATWPGSYDTWHTPPALEILPGSRIKEGQKLLVSYYHALVLLDNQVTPCLSDPKLYTILADQMQRVNNLFTPSAVMMSHDEIRAGNLDEACLNRHMTPGQELADNVRRCYKLVKAEAPRADVMVWSDMFDPAHNARADYYLVNGSWAGSWEGLPKDVIVVDWYFDARKKTLPFFAKRGNPQILAGYYDGDPGYIRTWLEDARGVADIQGVMYTTWENRYDSLEAFAKAAWGNGK